MNKFKMEEFKMKKILNRNGGGAKLLSSPSSEGILYYNNFLKSGGVHRIIYVPLLTILEDSIPSLEVSVITYA